MKIPTLQRKSQQTILLCQKNKLFYMHNLEINNNPQKYHRMDIAALKNSFIAIMISISGVLSPVIGVMYILGVTFILNFAGGLYVDINVNHSKFDLKKAFAAVFQMTFLAAFIYYIHMVFGILKMEKFSEDVIKWISILVVYFYSTNIMRNASLAFPKNLLFSFLYMILSTQIFNRIKELFMLNFNLKSNGLTENERNTGSNDKTL